MQALQLLALVCCYCAVAYFGGRGRAEFSELVGASVAKADVTTLETEDAYANDCDLTWSAFKQSMFDIHFAIHFVGHAGWAYAFGCWRYAALIFLAGEVVINTSTGSSRGNLCR